MKIQTQRGFTFIELLIYMGLLGILIVVMSEIFIAILALKLESSSASVVQQDGTYISTRMSYDIQRAQSILYPAVGQSSSRLSLDIVENGTHHTYEYASNSGILTLSDGTHTDIMESSGSAVTQFVVTRVGNSATMTDAKDTVDVVLTTSSRYQLPSGTDSMNYHFAAGLR
jgi:prepilin-type N-terminal cleavage/methylation domain-containing protein